MLNDYEMELRRHSKLLSYGDLREMSWGDKFGLEVETERLFLEKVSDESIASAMESLVLDNLLHRARIFYYNGCYPEEERTLKDRFTRDTVFFGNKAVNSDLPPDVTLRELDHSFLGMDYTLAFEKGCLTFLFDSSFEVTAVGRNLFIVRMPMIRRFHYNDKVWLIKHIGDVE